MTLRRRSKEKRPLWLDLTFGATAGAIGTWLMAPAMKASSRVQPESHRRRESMRSLDQNASVKAATRLTRRAGVELSKEQQQKAGIAMHWTYGVSCGAGYALLARRLGRIPPFSGPAFGALLWAVGDEALAPLLGLAPRPQRLPLSTHAKALGAHVAYGAGVETTMRSFDRVSDWSKPRRLTRGRPKRAKRDTLREVVARRL